MEDPNISWGTPGGFLQQNVAGEDFASGFSRCENLAEKIHGLTRKPKPEPRELEALAKARNEMAALPGHAEHFRRMIESTLQQEYDEVFCGVPRSPGRRERYHTFVLIGASRSPACIALLGEYLEDKRDVWKDVPRSDCGLPRPNRIYALEALEEMEIEGIYPAKNRYGQESAARAELWKIWMAQVRMGIRTYHFKGDRQNYSISGPVYEERIPPLEMSQPFLPAPDLAEVAWIEKRELEKAVEEWRDFVKETVRNPTQQAIVKLARGFYSKGLSKELEKELWDESSKALCSIPNCAGYFEGAIHEAFEAEMVAASAAVEPMTSGEYGMLLSTFDSRRAYLCEAISTLRTPECVSMLCKILDDDRNPWAAWERPQPMEIKIELPPFSIWGGNALASLQIENGPPTTPFAMRSREAWLKGWKRWRDQLRDGIRTYRFKNDPQRYDPNGPVMGISIALPPSVSDTWKPPAWWIGLAAVELGALFAFVGLRVRKRSWGG